MKKISLFLIATLFSTHLSFANDPVQDDRDPVARINYPKAFDFSKIQMKHQDLMYKLGCGKNVFNADLTKEIEEEDSKDAIKIVLVDEPLIHENNKDLIKEEFASYKNECIKQLYSERRGIILRPAKESILMMSMMAGAVGGIMLLAGPDSFGGSFGVFAAVFNSVWYVRDIIKSGYNWYNTPPHPIDKYELKYAENQCFIPNAIWPMLQTKFMLARNNQFEQQAALEFIDFTLGLTAYKPIKHINEHIDLKQARRQLSEKIDEFFTQYEEIDEEQKHLLKVNAQRFLGQLLGKRQSSRYLYLVGPGGIGKTHFARELVKWIEEICPNALHLQELAITAPEELEGNANRPGAFLRVLRNQCQAKKKGSIVFIDEANWLNEPSFEAPSKRVFNGAQSKLSTSYFGAGQDGTGIELDLPPMLVIVASNNEIKDDALKSRFDCITFPKPKKETLQNYARYLALENELAAEIEDLKNDNQLAQKYEELLMEAIKETSNFREIQSIVPTILNKWEESTWIDF